MSVVHRSNNRVLPSNARAVDVASSSLDRIAPVQARKYDAAFRVAGYSGILYNRLTSGVRCACTDHSKLASSRLGLDGKADSGLISSLLTGGEFGVREYGTAPARTAQESRDTLEIQPLSYLMAGIAYPDETNKPPSLFDVDAPMGTGYMPATMSDHYSTDPNSPTARTIVSSGTGPNGPVADSDLVEEIIDLGLHNPGGMGNTDASCPVCFGSGFVGGFSVYRGWRRVLLPYAPEATLPPYAVVELLDKPARAMTDWCDFTVSLPSGVVSVDSVRVYMDDQMVDGARVLVDSVEITSDQDIVRFCDGKPHIVRVSLPDDTCTFSHLELQFNQSTESAYFEFPKQTKSSDMSLLERTEPFQITFSPLVPMVKTQDIVVESVTGKVLQVKSTTGWNDHRSRILGWESDVRPVQPHELYTLLPRRRPTYLPKVVTHVRDNSTGKLRT